jgi:imidazoleglycerol-phosphate dehydratase
MGIDVVDARLVEDGRIITSSGVTAAIDLGLYLCLLLGGEGALYKIQQQMDYPHDLPVVFRPSDLAGLPVITKPEPRCSHVERSTRETQITVNLTIDGNGNNHIATGLPFLDHMLTQIAVHGLFDLEIQAHGDIQIDPHHTMEDVALTLGQAFQQALGDRAGLVRMAAADCPMDESLAWVAVDFSGRPYTVVQATWHGPVTGGLPTSLFKHFLESFASQARCNLHARVVYGEDDHHQAEALFKALARALDAATRLDPRRIGSIPSSKGVII